MHHPREIADVPRAVDRRRDAVFVNAGFGIDPIEEQDVPTELLKADQILQVRPGVTAPAGPLRDRPRNRERSSDLHMFDSVAQPFRAAAARQA